MPVLCAEGCAQGREGGRARVTENAANEDGFLLSGTCCPTNYY